MELLFLDEPTSGLDPSARRKLLDFLKNKVKTGITIFYTTHVLTEAEYLCDKIAIINKGKIIAVDSPDELTNRFGNEKTIKIHIAGIQQNLLNLLADIQDCKIYISTNSDLLECIVILVSDLKFILQSSISANTLSNFSWIPALSIFIAFSLPKRFFS